MSLKLSDFKNGSTADTEYIEFQATEDVQLKHYAILDQTYKESKVSNIHKHFFHMPDLLLKKGEYVRIYTGKGENKKYSRTLTGGTKVDVYYRYWGSGSPVWNNGKDKLELIKFQYIDIKTVK